MLAPALRARYGLSLPEVGVVLGAPSAGMILTLYAWGLAADRVGERAVIGVGLAGAGAALAGAAYASGFGSLVALLALSGLFGASVNGASGRAVMAWFPESERGLALGIRQTSVPLGGAIVALGLPAIASPRTALLALSGGCLAGGLAGVLGLRERPREAAAGGHPLRDRRIWRLTWASSLILCPQIGIVGFVVLFLHRTRGFTTGEAGAVLAAIQVGGAALRVGSGRWSDRIGARIEPLRRLALALTVAALAAAALVNAPSPVLVPALVLAGVLAMGWNGLAFTAVVELAGLARSGTAIGLQQTMLAAASAAVPVAFAAVVSASSWRVGFALVALFPLAGVALLRPLGR